MQHTYQEKLQDLAQQMLEAQYAIYAIDPEKSQDEYIAANNKILKIQESLIALDDSGGCMT